MATNSSQPEVQTGKPFGSIESEPSAKKTLNGERFPMSEPERRLLDFVAALILELAHTHPRITQEDVAIWLARAVLGPKR